MHTCPASCCWHPEPGSWEACSSPWAHFILLYSTLGGDRRSEIRTQLWHKPGPLCSNLSFLTCEPELSLGAPTECANCSHHSHHEHVHAASSLPGILHGHSLPLIWEELRVSITCLGKEGRGGATEGLFMQPLREPQCPISIYRAHSYVSSLPHNPGSWNARLRGMPEGTQRICPRMRARTIFSRLLTVMGITTNKLPFHIRKGLKKKTLEGHICVPRS